MRRTAILFALVALIFTACSSKTTHSGGGAASVPSTTSDPLTYFTGSPPWGLADHQADRMAKAGLPALTAEGSVVHFHVHLDVFDNGQHVTIPAGVGIDFERRVISPLHTHFDTGILHIEAEATEPVTLGQFLIEWGLRVDGKCIANVCAPSPIALYVNGAKVAGPVTEHVFRPDEEMALVLGTAPATIPKGYACVNPQDVCPNTPAP
jgi:hypothetical protein